MDAGLHRSAAFTASITARDIGSPAVFDVMAANVSNAATPLKDIEAQLSMTAIAPRATEQREVPAPSGEVRVPRP